MLTDRFQPTGRQPTIVVNERHLNAIAADAWQAVIDANDPPWFFRHGIHLAAIDQDEDGASRIIHLDTVTMRGALDRIATWVTETKQGLLRPARPPKDVVEDMLALAERVPALRGLIGTPIFAPNGELVSSPGYSPQTRLYYEPSGDPIPSVAERPSPGDLHQAKSVLLDDWLVDFPFDDEPSRTNLIAAALTPIARELIDGPTPLHVIDAPTEGTGKGFLAKSIGIVTLGREPSAMTLSRSEDEIRKRLTAVLRDGTPIVVLDNIDGPLNSASLASVLTTTVWNDRVLGKSEMVVVPNRALWLATGNNITLNGEMARRSVWIRLDARLDRPDERTDFKHDPFLPWVAENRVDLVWALLTLVRHWIAQGRPPWDGQVLGTFEEWCRVIGGILSAAGIVGLLGNRREMRQRVDSESEEWRAFVGCWWDTHRGAPVKTGELYDLVREWDLLPNLFRKARQDADERALRTMLGVAIAQRRDRRYGNHFIKRLGAQGHGAVYFLEEAEPNSRAKEPSPSNARGSQEVHTDNQSTPDSSGEPEEPQEPFRDLERAEEDTRDKEGCGLEVPNVPEVLATDSEWGDFDAEPWRNLGPATGEVPHCWGCGSRLSVLMKAGGLCGRCRLWGVVPEWAKLVSSRLDISARSRQYMPPSDSPGRAQE